VQGAPPDEQMRAIGLLVYEIDRLRTAGYASLPLAGFEPLARLGLAGDLNETIENAANPGYYAPFSIAGAYDRVEVPALNIGGWYDVFARALANTARCAAREASAAVGAADRAVVARLPQQRQRRPPGSSRRWR
jgi:hypothetical protein